MKIRRRTGKEERDDKLITISGNARVRGRPKLALELSLKDM